MISLVHKIFEFTLYVFGILYIPIYWLIKLSCGFSKGIWVRNSVYFGNQIFYLSDIDLTIADDNPGKLVKKVHFLKKFLLMIGELNVYKTCYFPYLAEIMNPCELSRDPRLAAYISTKPNVDVSDALVFLLRSYQSDFNNLQRWSWLRVRKWNSHFVYLTNYFQVIDGLNLFETIEELSDGELNHQNLSLENKMLFPHLWFDSHYSHDELIALGREALESSVLSKDLFRKQLGWEFCGVMSQIEVINNNDQVRNHFTNIVTLLSEHKDSYSIMLKEKIISFCNNELLNP